MFFNTIIFMTENKQKNRRIREKKITLNGINSTTT